MKSMLNLLTNRYLQGGMSGLFYFELRVNCPQTMSIHQTMLMCPFESQKIFFLYLLLPIRAHKSTVMSRNNDQQVRHILKSIILLCASHLSLSSSHRLGFFARTGTATLARPLDRLIFNLVLSLVSETSTRFRLRHPQWGP